VIDHGSGAATRCCDPMRLPRHRAPIGLACRLTGSPGQSARDNFGGGVFALPLLCCLAEQVIWTRGWTYDHFSRGTPTMALVIPWLLQLHIVAQTVPPREATRSCWKFAPHFGVHNSPSRRAEQVQFFVMPRPWRRSAWPVFQIFHRSPHTALSQSCMIWINQGRRRKADETC